MLLVQSSLLLYNSAEQIYEDTLTAYTEQPLSYVHLFNYYKQLISWLVDVLKTC